MRAYTLVGAQAGSEGKGLIASKIAGQFDVHVRTGGPNAGHTFYHGGSKWVARGLPVGWINPEASLVIGPGAMIDAALLAEEIDAVEHAGYRVRDRLWVHPDATVITPEQHAFEGGVDGLAHQRIGSTGEGVGIARMAKIARRSLMPGPHGIHHQAKDSPVLRDVVRVFDYPDDAEVLLEGTQGSMLSLVHGPWPYVTSADTNSGQLLTDAGISPGDFMGCYLVARAFPIRVAGNSGPLPDETMWEEIGQPEERTTVTLKVRRVGRWNRGWVEKAVALNRPCRLIVTFADYLHPEVAGVTEWEALPGDLREWCYEEADAVGAVLHGVGTGPDSLALA